MPKFLFIATAKWFCNCSLPLIGADWVVKPRQRPASPIFYALSATMMKTNHFTKPLRGGYIALFVLISMGWGCAVRPSASQNWISLFNGKNLDGWDIKITGSPMNTNYKNTFRVENGILKCSYDEYDTFKGEYGHIYYQKPFSYYLLRTVYRFTGNQTPGGESWNVRNSGVMIHAQSAASVGIDQTFPVSLEIQFLGGLGNGPRTTGNLCTPGTTVVYQGKTFTDHIINSTSKTYDGDQWVVSDAIVLGDSIIRHFINGEEVLSYTHAKIGGGFVSPAYNFEQAKFPDPAAWEKKDGVPLREGYIALQAESHPIEFKTVAVLDLTKVPNWQKMDLYRLFPKYPLNHR